MSEPGNQASEAGRRPVDDGNADDRQESADTDRNEVIESELPDLTTIGLEQLRISGNSAIAHALRRLADELSSSEHIVAGFQSAI
jgi:FXSXX-COOH protein